MATDGVTPPTLCNREIFLKGRGVCVVDGRAKAIERWVRVIAAKANAQVDWHYNGGRANVLHLGDNESRQRVLKAINELESELDGTILSIEDPSVTAAQ